MKPASAKQDFFTNLAEKLRGFDENVVGSQLGELLLSRIVLLDVTFQVIIIIISFLLNVAKSLNFLVDRRSPSSSETTKRAY